MTREEKCQLAIERGITYNPETGDITNRFGKIITGKTLGYICLKLLLDKKAYQLRGHQLAWYITHGTIVECIDHINGIKDDNRICNLRTVSTQENSFNRTKAKGYCWFKKTNKWTAQIHLNSNKIHLGYFDNEDEARAAYLQGKEKYHII